MAKRAPAKASDLPPTKVPNLVGPDESVQMLARMVGKLQMEEQAARMLQVVNGAEDNAIYKEGVTYAGFYQHCADGIERLQEGYPDEWVRLLESSQALGAVDPVAGNGDGT